MKQSTSALIIVIAAVAGLMLGGVLAALTLSRYGPSEVVLLFFVVALILAGVVWALKPLFQSRSKAPARLAEDIQVIMSSNPAHRINAKEATGLTTLAETLNSFADHYQSTLESQSEQITQANAGLANERNKLAALITKLTGGVVVCNSAGRILLYNQHAQQLLEQVSPDSSAFVGLGRSIFGLIERNAITYALNRIELQQKSNGATPGAQFVVTTAGGQLVKVQLSAIRSSQNETTGFILTVVDVSQQAQSSRRIYKLVTDLAGHVRSSSDEILDVLSRLTAEPEPAPTERIGLYRKILNPAQQLQTILNDVSAEYTDTLNIFDWRLEEIRVAELLPAIRQALTRQVQLAAPLESGDSSAWVRVDSYALVVTLSRLVDRLQAERGVKQLALGTVGTARENRTAVTLTWPGNESDLDTLKIWTKDTKISGVGVVAVSLWRVIDVLNGEVVWLADQIAGTLTFQIWLPTVEQPAARMAGPVSPSAVLELFDFDLFRQSDPDPELDKLPLSQLSYTVFDTETTGLQPDKGDEITSIGAARIVNGRMLRREVFDQLVDPKRTLPAKSIEITGITPDMVQGQPAIEQVLPKFFEFTKDTVLVAHNAAFDMKMLQVKEAQTGVAFKQPVLDTLLLAELVSPEHRDYSLDMLAERLGIDIIARHSSLGDALVTGDVLLRLIPLLAEKGITTLGEARRTSQESYLARIKY